MVEINCDKKLKPFVFKECDRRGGSIKDWGYWI